MKGVNIGGVNINNLRYADETVLLAEGPMFLQALLTAVNEKGKPYDMEMNIMKTKSMVISRKKPVPNISIRRMLRISWKEHKTNGEVLHKMKTKRSLLNTIKKKGNVNILDI